MVHIITSVFNLIVFFIRIAGIINSIQTDSSWKTKNLSQECKAFTDVVKGDMKIINEKLKKSDIKLM